MIYVITPMFSSYVEEPLTPVFDEDQRKAPNDQSTKLTHERMNKDT